MSFFPSNFASGLFRIVCSALVVGMFPWLKAATFEFTNPTGINILDHANASPYPSSINVSGVTGTVTGVKLMINGYTHSSPVDVDVFLMAPNGRVTSVFSAAAGSDLAVSGVNLIFDDTASGSMPYDDAIVSGSYLTSNYDEVVTLPPGGVGSMGNGLTPLASSGVNGVWKLFVNDLRLANTGSIGSWGLIFETGVPAPELSVEESPGIPLAGTDPYFFFSDQAVGTTGPAQTFLIKNLGTAVLTIGSVAVAGDNNSEFLVNTTGMLNSIPAGGQTTFTVTFKPTDVDYRQTTLHITSNDADEAITEIGLLGDAAYPGAEIVVLNPDGVEVIGKPTLAYSEVGLGSTETKTFTIKNTGIDPLLITGVTTSGGTVAILL